MEKRVVVMILVLGLLGWLGLTLIQWRFGIGEFASSPQEVTLRPSARAIVAGGRAVIGFVGESPKGLALEVKCAAETTLLELWPDDAGEPVCGVTIRAVKVPLYELPPGHARFEISWGD